jgi:hypothetical protein
MLRSSVRESSGSFSACLLSFASRTTLLRSRPLPGGVRVLVSSVFASVASHWDDVADPFGRLSL